MLPARTERDVRNVIELRIFYQFGVCSGTALAFHLST